MAQTEALMLVGLGVVLALLLVFAFGGSVWSLTGRMARRKLENELPAELLSLRADRDRLRAEHAAMTQRLEALEESARNAAVTKDAEVARQRNRVLGLTENIEDKNAELSDKGSEVASLSEQVKELSQSLDLQRRATDELARELESRDKDISDLHTQIDILRADLADSKIDRKRTVEKTVNPSRSYVQRFDLTSPHADASQELSVPSAMDEDDFKQLDGDFLKQRAVNIAHSETVSVAPNDIGTNEDLEESKPLGSKFNFDRPKLRTVPPSGSSEINTVIKEARRNLAETATEISSEQAERGKPAQGVISLAKRLRALQAKSDEKISKTLK